MLNGFKRTYHVQPSMLILHRLKNEVFVSNLLDFDINKLSSLSIW